MLDLIPKYGGIAIQELRVDNWHGRTLVDLNLIQSFGVMVMGIRPAGERAFQFVPPALTVLHKGDTLVVAGRADAVRKLESLGYTRLYDLGGILSWPYEIEGDFEGHF